MALGYGEIPDMKRDLETVAQLKAAYAEQNDYTKARNNSAGAALNDPQLLAPPSVLARLQFLEEQVKRLQVALFGKAGM
jgi:hypothetical protein